MKLNPRKLAERSYLAFQFPTREGSIIQSFLPMLENCELTESKKSNLSSYDILSRNSSLFAFLGAKARVFNLKFKITFLNVLDYISREGLDDKYRQYFNLFYESDDLKKKGFRVLNLGDGGNDSLYDVTDGGSPLVGMDHASLHREFYRRIAKLKSQESTFFDNIVNFSLQGLGISLPTDANNQNVLGLNKMINTIIFWVNLVRSSVLNNSKDTTLGPPIVRLNHGIMYNNIPCVVENYSITPIIDSGYDIETLLAKQIEITMNLSEVRTGNFGEFKPFQIIDADNNVGWEAVIDNNNIDPYTGDIR